jgi:hypothetical protein
MPHSTPELLCITWPSKSLAQPDLIAALQDRLSVALIATPRAAQCTCCEDEMVADVMARNGDGFDYFPVTDTAAQGRRHIIGLIRLVPYLNGRPPAGSIREQMSPLSEDDLIGADAGILTFVRTADRHACRLVISGAEVSGLVNLADLQKLPVRAALFAMIIHLEMTMTEVIRREFGATDGWKKRLSENRRTKLDGQRCRAQAADTWIDDLLLTQFADKTAIIRKSPSFSASKAQFQNQMHEAQTLRNDLAHANDYASTREQAAQVCAVVRNVEHWIERLNEWHPANSEGLERC